ncbi:rhodanese-like domain-containing protein [Lacinutrix iliipiscaria]|uniref:Rhodanese-like domain-containing protein n=1 Tax=Lacinutrix iliipiscaria TaxID=1230532 RepID=A0ABW5WRA0_9FLAO
MKNLSLVLVFVIAFISLNCKNDVDDEIKLVSTEEMQTILKMDEVQLVDVRTPEEFSGGYIKNAQNIDFMSPTFEQDILKLDKEKPVVLYCHSGRRSANCAQKLKDAGFKKIYDLEGGISTWKHEGLAVEH